MYPEHFPNVLKLKVYTKCTSIFKFIIINIQLYCYKTILTINFSFESNDMKLNVNPNNGLVTS